MGVRVTEMVFQVGQFHWSVMDQWAAGAGLNELARDHSLWSDYTVRNAVGRVFRDFMDQVQEIGEMPENGQRDQRMNELLRDAYDDGRFMVRYEPGRVQRARRAIALRMRERDEEAKVATSQRRKAKAKVPAKKKAAKPRAKKGSKRA